MPSGAFILTEPPSRGRFDAEKADALQVPNGPLRGQLAQGQTVTVAGRVIQPAEVCGPPRPPRTIALVGDTNDSSSIYQHLQQADLILHECTFADSRGGKAKKWGHSTVDDCIDLARATRPRQLVLTHFSSRYDQKDSQPTVEDLRQQVELATPESTTVIAAADLINITIPIVGAKPAK